ncbi:GNAT family N-acetyltransferase [Micromonospora sp. NPDC020750]|uniref:GNAT family N-acetyltransferase n=1 Tax=unclassified Micromonospora TaxID=2617518 RepID=UPI0037A966C1
MSSRLRSALSLSGVPGLICRRDPVHRVRSARLDISVARVRDLSELASLEDDETRHRNGRTLADEVAALDGIDPALPVWTREYAMFVARERITGRPAVSVTLAVTADRRMWVGGWVVADHRRRGYAREALDVVCAIVHRHLGVAELHAARETDNVASGRWLASCGFVQVDGPSTHVLPDGRSIEPDWWRHTDERARRRCVSLHAPGLTILFG